MVRDTAERRQIERRFFCLGKDINGNYLAIELVVSNSTSSLGRQKCCRDSQICSTVTDLLQRSFLSVLYQNVSGKLQIEIFRETFEQRHFRGLEVYYSLADS
uniref:Uncharacterized protein n=1 Tax=Parascaris univalens TaxID=6257 RepID=A0A915BC65_PARUN